MPAKTATNRSSSAMTASQLTWSQGAKIAARYLGQFQPGGKLAGNLVEAKAALTRDFGMTPAALRGLTSARLPDVVAKHLLAASPSRIMTLSKNPLPAAKKSKPTKTAATKGPASKAKTQKPVARSPRKKKSETDGMIDATVKIVEMIRKAAKL